MKKLLTLFLWSLIIMTAFSQEKTFIREYYYKASETDSKITARQKALEQVKILLIEELGTYVESWVNYDIVEKDNKITKDFFQQEIKTLSVGTTETKILEENWTGYEYYVKAQIKADPDEVVRRINQTLSARKSNEVIDSLKLLLQTKTSEIELRSEELEQIEKKLDKQKEQLIIKEKSINELDKELELAKKKLDEYLVEENRILSEIQKIENRIKSATNKAIKNVRLGMTSKEVLAVCGLARSISDCSDKVYYNYGNVWVCFESNIVFSVISASDYKGPCSSAYGNYKEKSLI